MGFIPNFLGKVDPQVNKTIADLYARVVALEAKEKEKQTTPPIDYAAISKQLSIAGTAPLNISGLIGELSQVQKSKAVPITTGALPAPGSPLAQPGSLVQFNGILYFYNTNTNPGVWTPVGAVGVFLQDTHANRIANFPPGTFAVGTVFWETDRNVLYLNEGTFGSSHWEYILGQYDDVIANRPSDLGSADKYFLFFATDTRITFVWTGGAWSYVTGIHEDVIANRPAPQPDGYLYAATDWRIVWVSLGGAWHYFWGIMDDVAANRPASLGANDVGFAFIATDTLIFEYWDGAAWHTVGAGGITQLTGDVTAGPGSGSQVATAVKIPPGVTLTGTPGVGDVPTATSSTTATWQPGTSPPGAWTPYTPTITAGAAVTTTTLKAAYQVVGKTVVYRIYWLGSLGGASANISFTVPVSAFSSGVSYAQMAPMTHLRGGTLTFASAVLIDGSSTFTCAAGTNFPGSTTLEILLEGVYEAA
jgi:hypothetical protein